MSFSDRTIPVHGYDSGEECHQYFPQSPDISISLSAGNVTRSAKTISCSVKADINGLKSSESRFGYRFKVYARLSQGSKNGDRIELAMKDVNPYSWTSTISGHGSKTITLTDTSTSTSVKLEILLFSICSGCNQSAARVVKTLTVTSIPYEDVSPVWVRSIDASGNRIWKKTDKLYAWNGTAWVHIKEIKGFSSGAWAKK